MTRTSPDELVDSPRFRALQMALFNVRRQVIQLEDALDPPFRLFSGRAVWVGPAARNFGEDLSRQRQALKRHARRIVEELEDELGRIPDKVPPAVAQVELRQYGRW
jgi:hypothetical protein